MMKKRYLFTALVTAAMLGLIAVMVVDLLPLLKQVAANTSDESKIVEYIASYGFKGVPILMGLQALQVITAIIPSAAIQLLTGLCYGVWWGTLINLAGCMLGNLLVFAAMRQLKSLAEPLIERSSRKKSVISLEKLQKIKNPQLLAYSFFLIPGIPNGIMPYIFSRTSITLGQYLLANFLGSLPSTFLCTFCGDRISSGNYKTAIIVGAITVAAAVVLVIFKDKLVDALTNRFSRPGK
jgi:uncharacterized membrane protein YdjX (TVP38/TMEM64 family)